MRALVAALGKAPGGVDLVRLQKMPSRLASGINPLALLGREGSSSLNGNIIETGDDFEAYSHLDKTTTDAALLACIQSPFGCGVPND